MCGEYGVNIRELKEYGYEEPVTLATVREYLHNTGRAKKNAEYEISDTYFGFELEI